MLYLLLADLNRRNEEPFVSRARPSRLVAAPFSFKRAEGPIELIVKSQLVRPTTQQIR